MSSHSTARRARARDRGTGAPGAGGAKSKISETSTEAALPLCCARRSRTCGLCRSEFSEAWTPGGRNPFDGASIWSGQRAIELSSMVTSDEVAEQLGEVLNLDVKAFALSRAGWRKHSSNSASRRATPDLPKKCLRPFMQDGWTSESRVSDQGRADDGVKFEVVTQPLRRVGHKNIALRCQESGQECLISVPASLPLWPHDVS